VKHVRAHLPTYLVFVVFNLLSLRAQARKSKLLPQGFEPSGDVIVRAIELRPHVLPIEEIGQIIRWRPRPDLLAVNPATPQEKAAALARGQMRA
jgi:hypothetical protein